MRGRALLTAGAVLALAGCGKAEAPAAPDSATPEKSVLADGPAADIARVAAADLPPGVRDAVLARVPGMTIAEAERKERDGRVYFDVEGKRADGSEVEIDVLQDASGLRAVEIQRDVAWSAVPPAVSAAARPPFVPARVIESVQVDGGGTIYELFAPGRDDEPAMEVRWQDGRAETLTSRNPH